MPYRVSDQPFIPICCLLHVTLLHLLHDIYNICEHDFSGYTHDYNFDLVILLSTMGLFVFLLVVEMLLELRLIRKYSRFQLPEEYDIVTKVKFKYRQ